MKYNDNGSRVRAPAIDTRVSDASYDTAPANLSRTGVVDVGETEKVKTKVTKHFCPKTNKIIKDAMHLSTYNVRSLIEDWKNWN